MFLNPSVARRLVAVALCGACWPALAAEPARPPSTRPDPLDAAAPTLALPHRSVWAERRPQAADAEPLDWRRANEAVRRAGGWRAYAREAAP
ncbi:hypothetical protein [Leptothrix discophora]|uniref:Uncharacterized protein n=1 Tax=Leptothrix discophora TaxID=89 RepID=A0ABT9G2E8_LEPDI|nr:hypothetical protein [Leptothrix discophora]MDP4300659.1 hypothetical protein [Leptothrix discophora]